LWPIVTVALALAAAAAFLIGRIPGKTAPALALAAVLTGPAAASFWLVHNGGSAWDVPYAAYGTMGNLKPGSVNQFADHPVYGGTLLSNAHDRWDKLADVSTSLNSMLGRADEYAVVFTSGEASSYVATGLDRIVVIGGYTGLVPSPDTARLSALLDAHKVSWALLPGPMDTRLADPRIQLFLDRCSTSTAVSQDDGEYLYFCRPIRP
jgi:hypothetical protein